MKIMAYCRQTLGAVEPMDTCSLTEVYSTDSRPPTLQECSAQGNPRCHPGRDLCISSTCPQAPSLSLPATRLPQATAAQLSVPARECASPTTVRESIMQ